MGKPAENALKLQRNRQVRQLIQQAKTAADSCADPATAERLRRLATELERLLREAPSQ